MLWWCQKITSGPTPPSGVWGDKHNVTLMSSLQVLQNKAAKIVLDRPLYSFATQTLATLKWVHLKNGVFREDVFMFISV